jgi:hypothetical protein
VLFGAIGALLVGVVVVSIVLSRAGGNGSAPSSADRFMHLHGLAAPSWAANRLYISTHSALIEVDQAGQWRFISEERHDFMGFGHHPDQPNTMYSSGHPAPGSDLPNPIGFMRSEDGGVSWEPVSLQGQVDFHVMSISAADPNVIYGWNASGQAGLYRSSDGGRTWDRPAAAELMSQGSVFAIATDPTDANRLLAGTAAGLWESTDGGESWSQLILGIPITAVSFAPGSSTTVITYVADGQTGLVQIDDVKAAPTSTRLLGLVLPPEDAVLYVAGDLDSGVMYAGTAAASLFGTSDAGGTWEQLAREGERLEAGE